MEQLFAIDDCLEKSGMIRRRGNPLGAPRPPAVYRPLLQYFPLVFGSKIEGKGLGCGYFEEN